MKKQLLLMTSMMVITISLHAQSFETAKDAVKNMGVGWNLGNTLDAHAQTITDINAEGYWGQQGLDSETCWGQPKATKKLIHMMKEAGIGAIRVPVTWYNHMDKDGNVDEAWMKRVKEVVDYVIDEGLYCIINVHHDTGANSTTATHWIHADGNNYKANKTKFEYLWQQIANQFKDYGEKLIFESYNEMLDKYNSWNFAMSSRTGGYDATEANDAYDAINKYAKSFVTTVRNSGGNNAKRNLIINTYGASNGGGSWNEHLVDPLTKIENPESNATEGHIIFEVHAYPTITSYKSEVASMLTKLNNNLATKGPVIIGEWSSSNVDATETDYDKDRETFLQFATYFVKQAKNKGMGTFYWMGLSDGAARNLPAFNQPDLAETIVKAYHGDTYEGKYPSVTDFPVEYVVTYVDKWSELFLYGDWSRTPTNLSNYKGIRLVMGDANYSGKVQIKVYGENISGDNYKEQYIPLSTSFAETTAIFDASILGSTFWGITLQINSDLASTPMTARVKEAKLIKADGTEVPATITSAWGCTVTAEISTDIIPGDVNGDGVVNVTDIVATVNYIMEKPVDSFNKEAADLNGDGKINVTDIVMMVSIIMDGGN